MAVHSPGEADLNVYAYVSGRALQNVDPLGLKGEAKTSGDDAGGSKESSGALKVLRDVQADSRKRIAALEKLKIHSTVLLLLTPALLWNKGIDDAIANEKSSIALARAAEAKIMADGCRGGGCGAKEAQEMGERLNDVVNALVQVHLTYWTPRIISGGRRLAGGALRWRENVALGIAKTNADKALTTYGRRSRPGVSTATVTRDGKVFKSYSSAGGKHPIDATPKVKGLYDRVPPQRTPEHSNVGGCGEGGCWSSAERARVPPQESVTRSAKIGKSKRDKRHRQAVPACEACEWVGRVLGFIR